MQADSTRKTITGLAVFIAIAALVILAAVTNTSSKQTAMPTTSQNVQLSKQAAAPGSIYKNGTFKATGKYDSPGGPESFNLSITLKNDVIASTSAQSGSNDFTSREYQEQFISGYKPLVVGKKIDTISNLGVVSGSSLTSQGFDKALQAIKQEAKA